MNDNGALASSRRMASKMLALHFQRRQHALKRTTMNENP
jgi:hypothetical protein